MSDINLSVLGGAVAVDIDLQVNLAGLACEVRHCIHIVSSPVVGGSGVDSGAPNGPVFNSLAVDLGGQLANGLAGVNSQGLVNLAQGGIGVEAGSDGQQPSTEW